MRKKKKGILSLANSNTLQMFMYLYVIDIIAICYIADSWCLRSKLLTVSLCNHNSPSSGFTLVWLLPRFLVVLWLQELWLRSSLFILIGWIIVSLKSKLNLNSNAKKTPLGLPFCSFHRDPSVVHQVHFHLYSHCHPEK